MGVENIIRTVDSAALAEKELVEADGFLCDHTEFLWVLWQNNTADSVTSAAQGRRLHTRLAKGNSNWAF